MGKYSLLRGKVRRLKILKVDQEKDHNKKLKTVVLLSQFWGYLLSR